MVSGIVGSRVWGMGDGRGYGAALSSVDSI